MFIAAGSVIVCSRVVAGQHTGKRPFSVPSDHVCCDIARDIYDREDRSA